MGRKKRRVTRICENCGEPFEVIQPRIKFGRGKNCSPYCQYESIKKRPGSRIKCTCLNCDKVFEIYPSRIKKHKGAGKYCSRECRDKHRIGNNHPSYINGKHRHKYGPHWLAQRRSAKHRDNYTCIHCGIIEQDAKSKYGQPLHVHHKIPFRNFASTKEANQLSNLETLCATCHRKAESELQINTA